MSKKRKLRLFGIIAVVLAVLGGGAFALQTMSGDKSEGDSAAADSTGTDGEVDSEEKAELRVPVELTVAADRDLPSFFQTTGSLEARSHVDLLSKAQGQVTRLSVEEGDFVKKGQILAELDPREETILHQQATVSAKTAKKELERMSKLMSDDLASAKDLDAAKEAAERAAYEADLAAIRLDNKIIRAPFDGQVTLRNIEHGQTVTVGAMLFGVADVSPLEVKLYLPESVVRALKVGQPVEIRPDVDAEQALTGRVKMIAPVVDPATSTVKVTLIVDDTSDVARVGSFVRARITTDVHRGVVSVPKKALVPEAGASYLFVAQADTVVKTRVETGFTDDDFIEIISGVVLGDTVVTIGQGGLRDGSKIRDLAKERALAEDKPELADADSAGSE